MNCCYVDRVIAGYLFSAFAGHIIVAWAVNSLWRMEDVGNEDETLRPAPWIRFWYGVTERAFYTSTILLGKPEGIAVWLGFKAVMRWKINEADKRHIPGSSIYMIGTALNIAAGVAGAFIANRELSKTYLSWLFK